MCAWHVYKVIILCPSNYINIDLGTIKVIFFFLHKKLLTYVCELLLDEI